MADDPEAYLGHRLRGVSITHLAGGFLEEAAALGYGHDAKVYEVEPRVIRGRGKDLVCPRDGKVGAAYVDCLVGGSEASLATVMLSYTWGYTIGDIVDGLTDYCVNAGLEASKVYAWICCLCINQHRVVEAREKGEVLPFETFQQEFRDRVCGVGHIVALMSPWRAPQYITRVWCDFEMFTAVVKSAGQVRVTITMPPRESQDFRKALQDGEGIDQMWRTLSNLDIEQAQASVEEDRRRIFQLIRAEGNFYQLNCAVSEFLQEWIVLSSEKYVHERLAASDLPASVQGALCVSVAELLYKVKREDMLARAEVLLGRGKALAPENADVPFQVGKVKSALGDFSGALKAYGEARALHRNGGTLETVAGAKLLWNEAHAIRRMGNIRAAIEMYADAQRIMELHGALETADGAELLSSIGIARREMGDTEGARTVYERARQVREATGTLQSPEGASLLTNMAVVEKSCGDIPAALKLYGEARKALEQTGTWETSKGANLLMNIAIAREDTGVSALQEYEEARRILKVTGEDQSPLGAKLLMNVAVAHGKQGNETAKRDAYEEAREVLVSTGTLESTNGATLLRNLAIARYSCGDSDGALQCLEDAKRIRETNGNLDTEEGKEVLGLLEDLRSGRGLKVRPRKPSMKYVAAYFLLSLAGSRSPTVADVRKVLMSVDALCDDLVAESLVGQLRDMTLHEVIALGRGQLQGFTGSPGASGHAEAGPVGAEPAAFVEEKYVEEEEDEEDMDFDLFG